MMTGGFFTQLFQQFLALLSAFCIVPAPVPRFEALDTGPPGVIAAAVDGPRIAVQREPFVVRVIQTQINGAVSIGDALARSADGVTFSVLAVPQTLASALDRGGVAALPGGAASAAAGMVNAVENGSTRLIEALSRAIQAELALFGGRVVGPSPNFAAAPAPGPVRTGPVELIVRLPLAVGVAAADLIDTAMRATIIVTRAVVTAVTDIVEAAIPAPQQPNETLSAAIAEPRLTLPQAIAQAPTTISAGLTAAGGEVQRGVRRAATDFGATLEGRPQERFLVRAGGGAEVRTGLIAGDDNPGVKADVAVRQSRPRPVLGAVKAVTGTIKAVRDGVRAALGLPPRNTRPQEAAAE